MTAAAENRLVVHYPWQTAAWAQCLGWQAADKLPHALLIRGEPQIGKARFATALAQRLLCMDANADSACGRCRACELMAAGTHPDLLQLSPLESSRQIRIDQVRSLIDVMTQTSQQGGRRIAIVTPAEAMNINTANALLKLLEEPPANSLLVLVSSWPDLLPATIRSRCRQLALPLPAAASAETWLSPLVGGAAEAQRLLAECGGRPLAALVTSQGGGLLLRDRLRDELLQLLEGRKPLAELAEAWTAAAELSDLLTALQELLSDLLRARMAVAPQRPEWSTWLAGVDMKTLFLLIDLLGLRAQQVQKGASPNALLLVSEILIRIYDLFGRRAAASHWRSGS